ncbi:MULTISPECIES: TraR/DksA C4-type zinc finger protein [Bacillus]|uniref:TraR/DksA C4-type zinc finger protein n=1 Tax=Bacillus TaxID=1386 RepID=UPI0002F63B18|nr:MULTISPECIES: TraR/DksA C4-type zinc finger protein [Bacillus]
MISHKQLEALKQELLHLKSDMNHTFDVTYDNGNVRSLKNSVDELSSYDNHPADLGTELFDREKDYALEAHTMYELEKINQALQAIEDGSYGKCLVCHEDIPLERLQAIPYSLYCISHTPDQDIKEDRPVEEDIMLPPSRDSYDRKDGYDSFQEVARFGTSETTSDFLGHYDKYESIYNDADDQEGFTEDFETFIATDITGNEIDVVQSRAHENYEDILDEENIESIIGDIPFHRTDGYEED